MFTGIVSATGQVVAVEDAGADRRIVVRAASLVDCALGASVAVDGACLTVTANDDGTCGFDVSAETLSRTTLGERSAGDAVNLERPLVAGAELGGHIVQGHVDGVGVVTDVRDDGDGRRVSLRIDPDLTRYVVHKGSITVDGVSLTVSDVDGEMVDVALVPHTLEVTTLRTYVAGRRCNIEVDVLAKYVDRLVEPLSRRDAVRFEG